MSQQLLSAAGILGVPDLKSKTMEIPEWPNPDGSPGRLRLLQMSAERQILFHDVLEGRPKEDGMFILPIFCAVDEQDLLLFPVGDLHSPDEETAASAHEALAGYIAALRKKNFNVMARIQSECLALNGTGKVAKEVAKNASGEAGSDASPTSSPQG